MNWEYEITENEQEDEFIDNIKIYEEIIIGTLLEKGEELSNYARTFFKEKNFQGEVVEMIEKINTHDLRIEYFISKEKNGKILFKETVHSYDPAMKLFYSLVNYGDDQHMCVDGAFRFYNDNPISNFLFM